MLIFGTSVTLPEDGVDSDPEFKQNVPQKCLRVFNSGKAYDGKD